VTGVQTCALPISRVAHVPGGAMKGGVGTWATRAGDVVVGALVVLNAVGNVVDASGQILAGARGADGKPVEALRYLAQGGTPFGALSRSGGAGGAGGAGRNTTLAVVATNAQLDRVALQSLAHAAGDALARRIVPFGTAFDGDVVFAVSTAGVAAATPLQVEALAALAVPEAVEREPRLSADRVSEALHREILAVLERRDDAWLRVRAGDGYHAWIHSGYVALGTAAWADDWAGRATLRSLGAELRCEDARFRL